MNKKQRKELFLRTNGSHFMMAREYLPEYKEYIENKNDEKLWRQELINDLTYSLLKNGDVESFNKLYDLFENCLDEDLYILLCNSYKRINYHSDKEKLSIAETIIGRRPVNVISGLISYSIMNKQNRITRQLVLYVNRILSSIDETNPTNAQRAHRNKIKLQNILKYWHTQI